ncbi:MAG TPA: DEAD/DEAH box helicase, partial [Elusimicrobiota bacterium]|nr:DEAD/DEAH box helicase [Elusimicrobiota bacterium]
MAHLPTLLVAGNAAAAGIRPGETPLAFIQRWIRQRMPEMGYHRAALADRVLVVQASTGAGKSTVLPVGVFRLLRGERAARAPFRGAGVLCTQPRVLTALKLAEDVSAERVLGGRRVRLNPDMVLGETVSYLTGPVSSGPPAGLVFATAGVLAAQLRLMGDTELMGRYRVIQVDEAHERSQDTDMLMLLLRHFYQRNAGNERLPFLLLTSATFDALGFAAFFELGPANVVEVKGRAFPIREHFAPAAVADYAEAAATTVLAIHARDADPPGQGDVLVFVPGAAEARAVAERLERANE